MKKIIFPVILIIFLCYILIFPKESVHAAAFGLELWYAKMLPTLLPFAILSYILIHSGILDSFVRRLHRVIRHIFPVSSAGIYPLAAGLLFGFPMGSKITAELVNSGKMTYKEGSRLYCVCNNISPMFVGSYILNDCLKRPDLSAVTYFILYVPPLILYALVNHRECFPAENEKTSKKPTSINFQIIDAGIMNGFETLTKLGGYIMLFAILGQITTRIPVKDIRLSCLIIGFTEITNGIAFTAQNIGDFKLAYPLMMAYTAFGGLSGLAQTASMVKDTGFSLMSYLLTRIICSAITFLLALLLVWYI